MGIVTSKYLKLCSLWEGSTEQSMFKVGGIPEEHLRRKLETLNACDDLTPSEKIWKAAIEKTLQDPLGHKDWSIHRDRSGTQEGKKRA